jgi:hypothetical protein
VLIAVKTAAALSRVTNQNSVQTTRVSRTIKGMAYGCG